MPSTAGRDAQSQIYGDGVSGRTPRIPVAFPALERAARRRLSRAAFAYIAGSAGLERTESANRAAFARHRIVPRVLRDVAARDLGIELLGRRRATPFLLAPIGVLDLAHPAADRGAARAAAAFGIPAVLSNQASVPLEQVSAAMTQVAPDASRWFQLYWSSSDDLVTSLVRRAERDGCEAIVVTLDTHVLGWRPRDLDLGYLPFSRGRGIAQYTSDPVFQALVRERAATATEPRARTRVTATTLASVASILRRHPGTFRENLRSGLPLAAVETFLDVFANPSLTWDDLGSLRERTSLPIVLKGVMHPDDATHAVAAGVDAVWVSNHGGRQLDGEQAALDALPDVVQAVGDRLPVIFDSGVRGGADAVIALALGATAVAIGRPYVYALALAGETGVRELLRNLTAELDITLALAGVPRVSDLDASIFAGSPGAAQATDAPISDSSARA